METKKKFLDTNGLTTFYNLLQDKLTDYVPLAGGTMSGPLRMINNSGVFGNGQIADFWLVPQTYEFYKNAAANGSRLAYWRIAPEYAEINGVRQPERNTLYFQAKYRNFNDSLEYNYTTRLALHYQQITPPEGSTNAEDDPNNSYNRITAIGGFLNRLSHNQSFDIYDASNSTLLFSISNTKINDKWGIRTKFNTQVNIANGCGLTIGENEFTNDGLKYPLNIKYRDSQNALKEVSYRGGKDTNSNTIDLSSGVYYATTSKTATRVANPLIIKDSIGNVVVEYNGSVSGTELVLPGITEIYYENLKLLRDESKLTPGEKYRIIDYETIISGANTANHKFDIIVEALDVNKLSENVKVCHSNTINLIGEAFNFSSVTNWEDASNDPKIPSNIKERCSSICSQKGTRTFNGGEVVKVIIEGTTELGAGALLEYNGQVIAQDFGLNKNTYYLPIPNNIASNSSIVVVFYVNQSKSIADESLGASAYKYSQYFLNNSLASWELKYSLDNDTSRFDWANVEGKGVVYYMKDEYNNEAPYDFKNILIDGKYTFNYRINGINYDGSVKYGNNCFGNKLCSDATAETSTNKPGLPKIVFNNTSENAICKFNIFSNNAWNISFGSGCYYNEFIGKCENISLGNNCIMNVFHENCVSNTLKDESTNNTFGNNCTNNNLDYHCSHNTFGNNCTNNNLKDDCSYNKFDTFCVNNYLDMHCNDNTFGNNCTGNKFANTCTSNKLGSNCTGNMFGVKCASNELDNYCEANILGCTSSWQYPENMSDVTEGSCIGNKFGNNCVKIYLQNACMYNVFAANCGVDKTATDTKVGNKFGVACEGNTFGIYCAGNKFGNNCSYNNFDDYAQYNTFGNSCQSNIFGIYAVNCSFGDYVLRCKVGSKSNGCKISKTSDGATLLNNIKLVEFGDECSNVNLYVNDTSTTYLQNYRIANSLTGNIQITGNNPRGRSYITSIGKNSSGTIVQKCLEDVKSSISTTYSAGKLTISLI